METKLCRKCGESRPVTEFYVQDKATGRLNPWCKICYKSWYASRGGYETRREQACEQCGNVFTTSSGKARYCSVLCKQRARTARVNPPKAQTCPVCSSEFTTVRPKIYCSETCARRARAADGRASTSHRRHRLKKQYGMTEADFVARLEAQGNACAVCLTTEPNAQHGQWQIDHDHQTGRVRGLLCGPCNTGIGQLGDDPARLRRAAAYIESHRI